MRVLFVSDIHYSLKQLDWLCGAAAGFDLLVIGGDLLDQVRAERSGVVATMRTYPVVHARELLVRVAEPKP